MSGNTSTVRMGAASLARAGSAPSAPRKSRRVIFLYPTAAWVDDLPYQPANDRINIINSESHLHLSNLSVTLEFHSSMLSGFTTRTQLPTAYSIPVGIIISILVIVPGPA